MPLPKNINFHKSPLIVDNFAAVFSRHSAAFGIFFGLPFSIVSRAFVNIELAYGIVRIRGGRQYKGSERTMPAACGLINFPNILDCCHLVSLFGSPREPRQESVVKGFVKAVDMVLDADEVMNKIEVLGGEPFVKA